MFSSWLKKLRKQKPLPHLEDRPSAGENPANPGVAQEGVWTFNDGDREWQERINLVETLRQVLEQGGHEIEVDGQIVLCGGLSLRPLLMSMTPIHKQGVRTSTTIEIKHPLRIPQPIFEYQHSTDTNVEGSLRFGFEQWRDTDLVALLDCLKDDLEICSELSWKGWRIILGPVAHFQQQPAAEPTSDEHDFCPCCLFTNSIDAFDSLVDSKGFIGLRLFASRAPNGELAADCRVNGEDYDLGREGLLRYAKSWPGEGLEFRKQYVIVQRR